MTEKMTKKVFHVHKGLTNMASTDSQKEGNWGIFGIQGKEGRPIVQI